MKTISSLKPVSVSIKNVTGSSENKWLLYELSKAGVKSGDEVNGRYNALTGAVEFSKGGIDCVAWVNETCEIIVSVSAILHCINFLFYLFLFHQIHYYNYGTANSVESL